MSARKYMDYLRQENDALRTIAARSMPCHYCGVNEITKCPHGFPGCALADDLSCGGDQLARALIHTRSLADELAAALRMALNDYEAAYLCGEGSQRNCDVAERCRIVRAALSKYDAQKKGA